MNLKEQQFEVSNKNWRVNYTIKKQVNQYPQDSEDAEEEEKEADDFKPIYEQADIQFEILRFPDTDNMLYVQFKRKRGAAFLSYESADEYLKHLHLHNNATLEEGEAKWKS